MLIQNGNVHDGLGHVLKQDVRIADGLITALGTLRPEAGEEVFDAAGMEVLPGFVQALSVWGIMDNTTEIRPSSNDNDEKSNPITPELDGFYAFNGRAATAQQLGAFGLTSCGVAPTDNNLFGGTIAAFSVDGLNPYKMVLGRGLGMMASVTPNLKTTYGARQMAPMTRMWIFTNLAEQLRKAAEYKEEPEKPKDDKLAAIRRVVDGELPLFVSCDSALAAQRVHEITAPYEKLRLVLVNGFGLTGEEQWIIEKKIPIIVRTASLPLDEFAMTLSLPAMAKFAQAGVPVALSGENSNAFAAREDLLWNASEMMRVMHDGEQVLSMVTSIPARILGIDDKVGSIETGKRADIVLWSADPMLTYQAKIVRTYQGGEIIYKEGDAMKCL